jgi:4-hydroxy-2-oxoheptanedioate aldolase
LRDEWRAQRNTTNAWLTVPDAFIAEIAARAGFGSVCIDMQHGLIDYASVLSMLQAAQASGTPTLVRAPWNEPSILMRLLDAGADGVIVPMVETAAEAERAVAACRYPPRGHRSFGPTRAGLIADGPYFEHGDETALVFVMVESVSALNELDAILDTPMLDGVYVGPADLSLSMGHPPESDSERPDHQAAIRRVVAACHDRGQAVGLHTGGPTFAMQATSWGVDFVTIATDASCLKAEFGRRLDAFGAPAR